MVNKSYDDKERVLQYIADGQHRNLIGGLWEHIGKLQFDFMIKQGLKPNHKLIDIGCGCLRGGIHFIEYLIPGNYYGTDIHDELISTGIEKELKPLGLDTKCIPENFSINPNFDFSNFSVLFDYALALSVFTHIPFNDIRLCLTNLAGSMKVGGKFYATFFELPVNREKSFAFKRSDGLITYHDMDPYHYHISDMEKVCLDLPWAFNYIGEFGHPRMQHIVLYTRIS